MANPDYSVSVLDKVDEFVDLVDLLRLKYSDELAFKVADVSVQDLRNHMTNMGAFDES